MNIRPSNLLAILTASALGFGDYTSAPPMPRHSYGKSGGSHRYNLMRTVGRWGKSPEPWKGHNSRVRTKKGTPQPTWRDAHAKATNKTAREANAIKGREMGKAAKIARQERSKARAGQ